MVYLKASLTRSGNLVIETDKDGQAELARMADEDEFFGSDQVMVDVFDSLISNSELEWDGQASDPPVLSVKTSEEPGTTLASWWFADWAHVSPQELLADSGKCVFQVEQMADGFVLN